MKDNYSYRVTDLQGICSQIFKNSLILEYHKNIYFLINEMGITIPGRLIIRIK